MLKYLWLGICLTGCSSTNFGGSSAPPVKGGNNFTQPVNNYNKDGTNSGGPNGVGTNGIGPNGEHTNGIGPNGTGSLNNSTNSTNGINTGTGTVPGLTSDGSQMATKPTITTPWSGSGYLANLMDAHTASMGGNGVQPVNIFPGHDFSKGTQVMHLLSASGATIARVYHGNADGIATCDGSDSTIGHSWYIYFKDANGGLLGNFSSYFQDPTYRINQYSVAAGVPVPKGAATAWLGYFDNVQGGDPSSYDDNEGFRSPDSGSTGGCTFNMNVVETD